MMPLLDRPSGARPRSVGGGGPEPLESPRKTENAAGWQGGLGHGSNPFSQEFRLLCRRHRAQQPQQVPLGHHIVRPQGNLIVPKHRKTSTNSDSDPKSNLPELPAATSDLPTPGDPTRR